MGIRRSQDKSRGMSSPPLFPCPACGASLSRDAYACPKCGKPIRATPINLLAKIVIGALAFMIIVPLLCWMGSAVMDALTREPEPPQPGEPGYIYTGPGSESDKAREKRIREIEAATRPEAPSDH